MDEAWQVVVEMNQWSRRSFEQAIADITDDEADWRGPPMPNSVSAIVRHLRIEGEWHLNSLAHGEPMPSMNPSPAVRARIDTIPLDFRRNLAEFRELLERFIETLSRMTPQQLMDRTLQAYGGDAVPNANEAPTSTHLVGFHQALHVASHTGQIRTIRNLYAKSRGEPPRFFPENPTI